MIKIIVLILIISSIVLFFHNKQYNYFNNNLKIEQLETYERNKIENYIKEKNLVIVRNYQELNDNINLKILLKYNKDIKFIDNPLYTIKKIVNRLYNSFLLNKIKINNLDLKIIKQFGSDLSINKDIFLSNGKKHNSTTIVMTKFNRNYFHVIKGSLTIYLFTPKQEKFLYLNKTNNNELLNSEINVNNPNFELFPKYKNVINDNIKIILREGNLLFIPNNWSYYIIYNEETILLNYCFHNIISRLITLT